VSNGIPHLKKKALHEARIEMLMEVLVILVMVERWGLELLISALFWKSIEVLGQPDSRNVGTR
jgi:hypothetical protein